MTKHCYFNQTPMCSVVDDKWNFKCAKLGIHKRIYKNVSFSFFIVSHNGPVTRYVKLRFALGPEMPGMFSRCRLQRKLIVSDFGMYHGTCVKHVPWWMAWSLTRRGREILPACWASYGAVVDDAASRPNHGPLTRYVKLHVAHASGMSGTFPRHRFQRKPLVDDPGIHHSTCVTHVARAVMDVGIADTR